MACVLINSKSAPIRPELKRKVGNSEETPRSEDWEEALEYFRNTKELKEVILSGGDPLTLSDSQLDYLLCELKKIGHLNHVRIHTRYPVTLPFRITESLCEILKKYFPIFIVTHFNHANECSDDAREAIRNLIQIGNCTVLNQSVLLKNINDNPSALRDLNYKLISMGVKPYYLHQCDEVFGSSHFRVPIKTGLDIMKSLRGYMSGITVPVYVADLTGGGGKVPLPTDYLQKEDVEKYTFINFKGDNFEINK